MKLDTGLKMYRTNERDEATASEMNDSGRRRGMKRTHCLGEIAKVSEDKKAFNQEYIGQVSEAKQKLVQEKKKKVKSCLLMT